MAYRKSIRVIYSVKDENGYIVEKRLKFPTMQDAIVFLSYLKQNSNLIGKPLLEEK